MDAVGWVVSTWKSKKCHKNISPSPLSLFIILFFVFFLESPSLRCLCLGPNLSKAFTEDKSLVLVQIHPTFKKMQYCFVLLYGFHTSATLLPTSHQSEVIQLLHLVGPKTDTHCCRENMGGFLCDWSKILLCVGLLHAVFRSLYFDRSLGYLHDGEHGIP